jgi:hypothetical protein
MTVKSTEHTAKLDTEFVSKCFCTFQRRHSMQIRERPSVRSKDAGKRQAAFNNKLTLPVFDRQSIAISFFMVPKSEHHC